MHRVIQDHLEEVLAGSGGAVRRERSESAGQDFELHLQQCGECREEIEHMRETAKVLRQLRADVEPRAGFYARVMDRIEAQGAGSIWNVFSESAFGKRLAVASMALAVLFGAYLITSEQFLQEHTTRNVMPTQTISQQLPGEEEPAMVLGGNGSPNRDAVLVNLVTYREQ
jgi:hypothetical protein